MNTQLAKICYQSYSDGLSTMINYDFQYKTVTSNVWQRDEAIQQANDDGWRFVREEKVTARKVAIVFWKKVPTVAKNSTDSDSF